MQINGGAGDLLNINGTKTASQWRFNEQTGQWERLAAVDIAGGGKSHLKIHKESFSGAAGGAATNQMGKWLFPLCWSSSESVFTRIQT